MKQWITLVAAATFFASCSKQNLAEDNTQTTVTAKDEGLPANHPPALRAMPGGAFMSDWEQYSTWDKTSETGSSRFTAVRKTPEITQDVTNGGLVLTYAEINNPETGYASFANPTKMPFYYMPPWERYIPYMNYFSDNVSDGAVSLSYQVAYTKDDKPTMNGTTLDAVKFQQVILPKSFLDSRGLTAEDVRNNYTYDQVMNLMQ